MGQAPFSRIKLFAVIQCYAELVIVYIPTEELQ